MPHDNDNAPPPSIFHPTLCVPIVGFVSDDGVVTITNPDRRTAVLEIQELLPNDRR